MTFLYNRTSFERAVTNAGPGDDMRKRRLRAMWAKRKAGATGGGSPQTTVTVQPRAPIGTVTPGKFPTPIIRDILTPSVGANPGNRPDAPLLPGPIKGQYIPQRPPPDIRFPYLPQPGDDPNRFRTWRT